MRVRPLLLLNPRCVDTVLIRRRVPYRSTPLPASATTMERRMTMSKVVDFLDRTSDVEVAVAKGVVRVGVAMVPEPVRAAGRAIATFPASVRAETAAREDRAARLAALEAGAKKS